MKWTLPGTTLIVQREDASLIQQQFTSMFFGGGIVLSQIAAITGLEPYTIQNWVKREFLPPPEHKRYNMNQLCRIININMLKKVLRMEQICGLLTYVNGDLDDVTDDLIDDSQLYFLFVQLAANRTPLHDSAARDAAIDHILQNYREPAAGAKERVAQVLRIMLTAWTAAQLHETAEAMVSAL